MLRSIRIHATLVLLCILIGSSANATDRETQANATRPDAAAEYQMLDQGAEPQCPLRLDPKVGQRTILKWTTESESFREIDGVVSEGKPFPISSIEVGMEVTHVANGEITQRIEFLKFETGRTKQEKPDAAAEAMRAAFAQIQGKAGEITADTRGRFIRGGFDPGQFDAAAQGVAKQMNQQLTAMYIPLPAEPVGVGARWEVVREIIGAATKTNVRATYRIEAMSGSTVTLELEANQTGVPLSNTSSVSNTDAETHAVMTLDLHDISKVSSRTAMTLIILQEIAGTQQAGKVKVKNTDHITMTMSTAPWPVPDAAPDEKQPRQ